MPKELATIENRDLLAMEKVVLEAPKEELVGRRLEPPITDVNPGAETYGYSVLTRYGAAKIMANGADDLPLVDEDLERQFQPIYTIALGMSYTMQEVRAANMAGQPLDTMRGASVRRGIAEKENDLIFNGDPSIKLKGIVNADGIQAISADKTFAKSTGEEILETLRKAKSLITVTPGYSGARLKLVLPAQEYEELGKKFNTYDSRSTLEAIQGRGWFSSIETTSALSGKGDAGTDCAMILDSTAATAGFLLPQDITQYQQEQNYPNIRVPFDERTGGIVVKVPYAMLRLSGI